MSERRALVRVDHLIGLALALGFVAILMATASDLAMSRDESFYAHAAKSYARWLSHLFEDPRAAIQRESIDQAWGYNWEHPALMKLSFAWSWLVQQTFAPFGRESLAFRFPGMLTSGLLIWLIYAWTASVMRREGALFAALTFALMPRVFYHAHLACFDVPIAFFITLTAYTYWRSLVDWRWAPLVGIAFGLALATKHNSWILPGVLLIHFLWVLADRNRSRPSARPSAAWLPSMLLIGPLVFVGTWPWLWYDTAKRALAYAGFHLRHVHYTYEYFGTSYFEPPLPVSVPFVMTLFTVSATVLVLSLVGLVYRRDALRLPGRHTAQPGAGRRTELLWLGCALGPMLAIALPSTPIFGGTKHWITAYPFIACFAGWGFVATLERAELCFPAKKGAVFCALSAICLLPGLVETAHSHPFGLSHYTVVAGGPPGAADLGMNRQFWGFTTGSLSGWIAERLPDGGSVWTCDTTHGSWAMMQSDGLLPRSIVAESSMRRADLVLVHHEPHFAEVDYQAWVAFGSPRPSFVLTYDGVPIISVYENPNSQRLAGRTP